MTLSSDAWIQTFVYEETELELTPGQSGYYSDDTSMESVHFPSQLNIGEVRASVAVVPISQIPVFTLTPTRQFNQRQIREAKELADRNTAGVKQVPLSELSTKRHDGQFRKP